MVAPLDSVRMAAKYHPEDSSVCFCYRHEHLVDTPRPTATLAVSVFDLSVPTCELRADSTCNDLAGKLLGPSSYSGKAPISQLKMTPIHALAHIDPFLSLLLLRRVILGSVYPLSAGLLWRKRFRLPGLTGDFGFAAESLAGGIMAA